MEMIASKETLQELTDDLLIREADLLIKFINQAREQLTVIKEIADKRTAETGRVLYDGDLIVASDLDLLKTAVKLLVNVEEVTEEKIGDWHSSSDLILEVGDFYNLVENDNRLSGLLR